MTGAALLFFELGPHRLAIRLDEVVHVEARATAGPNEGALDRALMQRLGVEAPAITHRIALAAGGTLPSTCAPRAAMAGVAAWPLPPGLTPLGRGVAGFAESSVHGRAFILSAAGVLALRAEPAGVLSLEGFDDLE